MQFNYQQINGRSSEKISEICDRLSGVAGVSRAEIAIDLESDQGIKKPTAIIVDYFPEQTGARVLHDILISEFSISEITVKSVDEFSDKNLENDPLENLRVRFYTSLVFFFPMVVSVYVFPNIAFFSEWPKFILFRGLPLKFFVEWILATPVQLWLAQPVYKSAWEVHF